MDSSQGWHAQECEPCYQLQQMPNLVVLKKITVWAVILGPASMLHNSHTYTSFVSTWHTSGCWTLSNAGTIHFGLLCMRQLDLFAIFFTSSIGASVRNCLLRARTCFVDILRTEEAQQRHGRVAAKKLTTALLLTTEGCFVAKCA